MCWRAEGCKGLLEVGVKRSAECVLQTSTRKNWFSMDRASLVSACE